MLNLCQRYEYSSHVLLPQVLKRFLNNDGALLNWWLSLAEQVLVSSSLLRALMTRICMFHTHHSLANKLIIHFLTQFLAHVFTHSLTHLFTH